MIVLLCWRRAFSGITVLSVPGFALLVVVISKLALFCFVLFFLNFLSVYPNSL